MTCRPRRRQPRRGPDVIERLHSGAAPGHSTVWIVVRLLLAPVIFLGREPLRVLLAFVAALATVSAFGCLFSIRFALNTGGSLWEPLVMAYGLGVVASVAWWLRSCIRPMFATHY